MDTPFIIEQVYDSPLEAVWAALTEPAKMRAWYFPQLRAFKPVVGCDVEFTDDGSAYQKAWQVTDVVDGKKLGHSWVYKGYPGRSDVRFELFAEGARTRLRLTHTGLASFPDNPHFARQRFEAGWQTILGHKLKDFLEQSG
jgi:uncharacterized protein YndB with AHSA1/START domain